MFGIINFKSNHMAIRKSKEQSFQVNTSLADAKIKCQNAILDGGFTTMISNELLGTYSASYKSFTTVGGIDVNLIERDNSVNVIVKSTANTDNIFALFSSPNDKILRAFINNFK
jgi:hypothetical protein